MPGRILIVRPSALGDVCRTVPAAVSLRAAWPNATIDWVVQDSFVDAVRAHPAVNEVIPFPRDQLARAWRSPGGLAQLVRWFRELRGRRYDLVFDLQGLGRSGLITRATRASRRVGYANARELAWLGYTAKHEPPRSTHIVDQMLELLEREGVDPIPDLRLYSTAEAREWWEEQRPSLGIGGRYAVLAPTSRWASKRWPIERWRELIPAIRDRGYETVLVIGGPGEGEQVKPVFKGNADVVDLVDRLSIENLLAVIESSNLVVANDSAALHIAVGFNRPIIALFGPTDPAFVGPYGRDDAVVRAPVAEKRSSNYRNVDDELISQITAQCVIDRIDELPRAWETSHVRVS